MCQAQNTNIFVEVQKGEVMSIGERLTLLRKTLDINQSMMAMVMGCTQANISLYEKDGSTMSVKYLVPLRNAYNVNLDWLLQGVGEMFLPPTSFSQPAEKPVIKTSAPSKNKDKLLKKIDMLSAELQKALRELKELKEYISG